MKAWIPPGALGIVVDCVMCAIVAWTAVSGVIDTPLNVAEVLSVLEIVVAVAGTAVTTLKVAAGNCWEVEYE
jgi:hypothetical protein